MHRSRSILIIVGIALLALALGCSDDDETAVGPTPLAHASGAFYLDPGVSTVNFLIHDARIVDSAKIGDTVLTPHYGLDPDGFTPNFLWMLYLGEVYADTADIMYRSGDTALITIWGDGRSSTAQFVILHHTEEDLPAVYPTDTTIAADAPVPEIYWNRNDRADYYGINMRIVAEPDSEGIDVTGHYYAATTDTTFAIPAKFADRLSNVIVDVWTMTGPMPGSGISNWGGNFCTGRVCSFGAPRSTVITRSSAPRSAASPTTLHIAEDFDPRPGFLKWAAEQDRSAR